MYGYQTALVKENGITNAIFIINSWDYDLLKYCTRKGITLFQSYQEDIKSSQSRNKITWNLHKISY